MTHPHDPYFERLTDVEVWLAGAPEWRGRLMNVRPGHDRPYVVYLTACISTYHPPTTCAQVGTTIAFHADTVRLPAPPPAPPVLWCDVCHEDAEDTTGIARWRTLNVCTTCLGRYDQMREEDARYEETARKEGATQQQPPPQTAPDKAA